MKLKDRRQIKLTLHSELTLISFLSQNDHLNDVLQIEYYAMYVTFKKRKPCSMLLMNAYVNRQKEV